MTQDIRRNILILRGEYIFKVAPGYIHTECVLCKVLAVRSGRDLAVQKILQRVTFLTRREKKKKQSKFNRIEFNWPRYQDDKCLCALLFCNFCKGAQF